MTPAALPPPLDGIRVLDIGNMVAGPYGATMLGDLGAEVVKIEPPAGDQCRHFGPRVDRDSGIYMGVNRNKRGIVVDLTRPEGQEVYARLCRWADIVIENIRPEAEQRLGVSYEHTRVHNPQIIYISVSAYGEDGPYAGRPGIDPLAQALTGYMHVTGEPDGRPLRMPVPIADVTCANLVALAAVSAVRVKERQGVGQRIQVSLVDALMHMQATSIGLFFTAGYRMPRLGNATPFYAPFDTYVCQDGRSVMLGAYTDAWFPRLCAAMDRPGLADDPRYATSQSRLEHRDDLDAEISSWTATVTRDEALARLVAADVMAAPVNDQDEAFRDPQLLHNEMLVDVSHPTAGQVTVVGIAPKFGRTPGSVRRPPPTLGQHTGEVLAELGYSPEQVAKLHDLGVTTPRKTEAASGWEVSPRGPAGR